MKGLLAIVLALGACEPIWGAEVSLHDPANRPIEGATLAVACDADSIWHGFAQRSDRTGHASVGSIGTQFPADCDVYVAKPGYLTHRIRYRDLCPNGPAGCARWFGFDLTLVPELAPS